MGLKVRVTKEHISRGCEGDSGDCPIALAIWEQYKPSNLDVLYRNVYMDGDRYVLPSRAQKFIRNFDGGQNVKPFTFTLDAEE